MGLVDRKKLQHHNRTVLMFSFRFNVSTLVFLRVLLVAFPAIRPNGLHATEWITAVHRKQSYYNAYVRCLKPPQVHWEDTKTKRTKSRTYASRGRSKRRAGSSDRYRVVSIRIATRHRDRWRLGARFRVQHRELNCSDGLEQSSPLRRSLRGQRPPRLLPDFVSIVNHSACWRKPRTAGRVTAFRERFVRRPTGSGLKEFVGRRAETNVCAIAHQRPPVRGPNALRDFAGKRNRPDEPDRQFRKSRTPKTMDPGLCLDTSRPGVTRLSRPFISHNSPPPRPSKIYVLHY